MTDATRHTPGPWTFGDLVYDLDDEDRFIEDQNGGCIGVGYQRGDDEAGMDERDANARLIAAAPDLLAALQELVEVARPNLYPCPDKPDSPWAKLKRADAAIAKALHG